MIGVFGYLAGRSAYNRFIRQVRRLRTPRYLIALLLGLLYLWALLEQQRSARSGNDPGSAEWVQLLGAVAVAGAVAWAWVFGSERRALVFSPADVTFLFAGPVTRRWLIQYKLLRTQLPVLFNVLLWTLLLSREELGTSPWLRAISLWVLLTTLSLHRLGASFVRSSVAEHGRAGLRRRAVSVAIAAAALVTLGWGLWRALPGLADAAHSGGFDALLSALEHAMLQPPLRLVFYPFEVMVGPLAAPAPALWVRAMVPAVAVLLLHFVWVVRSDAAFEEAAVEHSLARAREASWSRSRGPTPEAARRTLPRLLRLSPTGWPAGAVLWKNLVAVVRLRQLRGALLVGSAIGLVSALLSFGPRAPVAEVVGWLALTWTVVMLLVGPQWVRNDLRSDLPHFDLLRSYPVRGRSLIAAEAAGSALVLTAIQAALLLLTYLSFLGNHQMVLTLNERTVAFAAALVYLPAINYIGMLIQNGGTILFPAWVRVGAERPGGVEALGQNMLLIVAYVGVLIVLLAAPSALAGGLYLLLRPEMGEWAVIPRSLVFLATVAFEAKVIIGWLGGVLERTDPAAVAIGT